MSRPPERPPFGSVPPTARFHRFGLCVDKLQAKAENQGKLWDGQGFNAAPTRNANTAQLRSHLQSDSIYRYVYAGHGGHNGFNGDKGLPRWKYTHYGNELMELFGCYSAEYELGKPNKSWNFKKSPWEWNVARAAKLIGYLIGPNNFSEGSTVELEGVEPPSKLR